MIKLTMPVTDEHSVVVSGEFEEEAVEALVIALGGTFGILERPLDCRFAASSPYSETPTCYGLPEACTIAIYDQVQRMLVRKMIFSQFT